MRPSGRVGIGERILLEGGLNTRNGMEKMVGQGICDALATWKTKVPCSWSSIPQDENAVSIARPARGNGQRT